MKIFRIYILITVFILSSCSRQESEIPNAKLSPAPIEETKTDLKDKSCESLPNLKNNINNIIESRKNHNLEIDFNYVNIYREHDTSELCTIVIGGVYKRDSNINKNNDSIKVLVTDLVYHLSKLSLDEIDKVHFMVDDIYNHRTILYTYDVTKDGLILMEKYDS